MSTAEIRSHLRLCPIMSYCIWVDVSWQGKCIGVIFCAYLSCLPRVIYKMVLSSDDLDWSCRKSPKNGPASSKMDCGYVIWTNWTDLMPILGKESVRISGQFLISILTLWYRSLEVRSISWPPNQRYVTLASVTLASRTKPLRFCVGGLMQPPCRFAPN